MDSRMAVTMENILRNHITCRICLIQGESMQPLFVEETGIIEQIEYCTGIRLLNEPELPSHICPPCLTHLNIAHLFKSTCLSSHHTLHPHAQTLLNTREVKIEREDDGWVKEERKSRRVKMKKEKEDSPEPEPEPASPEPQDIKPKPCKRTYKKSSGRRPKKFKFKRLWCATCQIKFASKEESDAHRLDKHPEDPWMCEICGKVFAHRGSHYTHVRSHLPPLHGCAHCDYKTWHRHDLVKHLRIHAGVKQYQCTQCARTFHTSSNLVSHVKRLHDRARPHQCSQCQQRFFDRTKLRRHMDSHNDVKRFECEVCHSCFTRRCYWKKHLQKQHGVTVPPQRPGRQKVNFLVGQELIQEPTAKTDGVELSYSLAPGLT